MADDKGYRVVRERNIQLKEAPPKMEYNAITGRFNPKYNRKDASLLRNDIRRKNYEKVRKSIDGKKYAGIENNEGNESLNVLPVSIPALAGSSAVELVQSSTTKSTVTDAQTIFTKSGNSPVVTDTVNPSTHHSPLTDVNTPSSARIQDNLTKFKSYDKNNLLSGTYNGLTNEKYTDSKLTKQRQSARFLDSRNKRKTSGHFPSVNNLPRSPQVKGRKLRNLFPRNKNNNNLISVNSKLSTQSLGNVNSIDINVGDINKISSKNDMPSESTNSSSRSSDRTSSVSTESSIVNKTNKVSLKFVNRVPMSRTLRAGLKAQFTEHFPRVDDVSENTSNLHSVVLRSRNKITKNVGINSATSNLKLNTDGDTQSSSILIISTNFSNETHSIINKTSPKLSQNITKIRVNPGDPFTIAENSMSSPISLLTNPITPLTSSESPLISPGNPLTSSERTLTSPGSPLTSSVSPLTSSGSPLTSPGSQVIRLGSQLTGPGIPLTSHGSQLTTPGSPLTSHGSSDFVRRKRKGLTHPTGAREGNGNEEY